jgi:non-ribosomal peptide synthetase component F
MTLLHQLIEAQAHFTPRDRAVAFEGRNLTYAELNRRADALAGRLRDLGVATFSLASL